MPEKYCNKCKETKPITDLGQFQDSIELLEQAVKYLKEHNKWQSTP